MPPNTPARRVTSKGNTPAKTPRHVRWPSSRRIRVFAFDPSLSTQFEHAPMNEATITVPWEQDIRPDKDSYKTWNPASGKGESLGPGPVGEYLEVIDYDPASGLFYDPVNLNAPQLLAQDGLPPSEGNPQFHQQMVYAVAMRTIEAFERALGRKVLWAPRDDIKSKKPEDLFVRRLRIYPHALREANAYYSPHKKALLFGYFPASESNSTGTPGGIVFTCLSHDIIAHEVTHAILDGIRPEFQETTNLDVPAFHEAFSDIVALFQHFAMPEALRHQVKKTRGDLSAQNLLGELAHQFGTAAGGHGALRSAIGRYEDGIWKPNVPSQEDYARHTECHARGSVLVAAVFEAFLTIYRDRASRLIGLASNGSGRLPEGNLHPALVEALSETAAKVAGHVLNICIRALDYCAPVDITFGDYLRALITADRDSVPEDPRRYRLAFGEAFRRRGIFPTGVGSFAEDALVWNDPPDDAPSAELLRDIWYGWYDPDGTQSSTKYAGQILSRDRMHTFAHMLSNQDLVHSKWLKRDDVRNASDRLMGLALSKQAPATVYRAKDGYPDVEVCSFRPARRITQRGDSVTDIVLSLTQRRRGYFDPAVQEQADAGHIDFHKHPGDFEFLGGCTMLIEAATGRIRYSISKNILSVSRLRRQAEFFGAPGDGLRSMYFGRHLDEPFAFLHSHD